MIHKRKGKTLTSPCLDCWGGQMLQLPILQKSTDYSTITADSEASIISAGAGNNTNANQ
jgi:hypothetical protein